MSKQTDLINIPDAITVSGSNVGIGTSSPSNYSDSANDLVVAGSGQRGITIASTDSVQSNLFFADADSGSGEYAGYLAYNHGSDYLIFGANSTERMRIKSDGNLQLNGQLHFTDTGSLIARPTTNALSFNTNGSERMRIDSSGNLLVGKTSADDGTNVGIEAQAGGALYLAKNAPNIYLNRLSSDGDIAKFAKDGTSVGSIGTAGNQSYIHGAGTDVGLFWGSNNVYPYRSSGLSDNTIDIGQASYRFKDAYLSGGIYLGGVGSANKLEDYEEGTFTPTVRGSSSAGTAGSLNSFGKYTKIGRQVNIQMKIDYQSHTGSGTLEFANLPFTSGTNNPSEATGTVMLSDVDIDSARPHLTLYIGGGVTYSLIFQSGDNIGWSTVGVTNEVSAFRLSITYFTS